jgi:transposase
MVNRYRPRTRGSMGALRRLALQLLKQGAAQADVSRELGVSRTTAGLWDAARDRDLSPPSAPQQPLAAADVARLEALMRAGACAYGFPTDEWTIARVAVFLEWEFGVVWSTLQVFRNLGDVLAKPPRAQ